MRLVIWLVACKSCCCIYFRGKKKIIGHFNVKEFAHCDWWVMSSLLLDGVSPSDSPLPKLPYITIGRCFCVVCYRVSAKITVPVWTTPYDELVPCRRRRLQMSPFMNCIVEYRKVVTYLTAVCNYRLLKLAEVRPMVTSILVWRQLVLVS